MKKRIMFVGMDVHEKSIDITTAEHAHDGKVAHFGCIGGDLKSLDKAVDKLSASKAELHLVYEAGPSGYVIYRHLRERNLHCTVVSPGSVPKKPSDRVKTDRRDAHTLAVQHRAGALRAIYVPEPEDEAIRDLVRAREDAVHNRRRARQRLNSFMLRHGRHYAGKKKWSQAHRRWLAAQSFEHAAQRVTMEEYLGAIEEAEQRVERISDQIQALIVPWRLRPHVDALQALRGVSWVVAVTVVAEVGDLSRFTPRRLMAFLGLVPSEYSSGERRRQGAITKTGNAHVRRVLCEAGWAYVHQPAISARVLKRQEGPSRRSGTSPGRRSCACASASSISVPSASTATRSTPPLPANWWASCGTSPAAWRKGPTRRRRISSARPSGQTPLCCGAGHARSPAAHAARRQLEARARAHEGFSPAQTQREQYTAHSSPYDNEHICPHNR